MELILIVCIAALLLGVLRPRTVSTVVYVPVEVVTPRGRGCLPLLLLVALAFVVLRLLS